MNERVCVFMYVNLYVHVYMCLTVRECIKANEGYLSIKSSSST